ncbi:Membrane protein involved in the export of O-antigen and teichoic acid [Pseudobutyrivibrio sp. OR37]|uniref:lipopolysaccharide biosynthesis protein n=1 Tax=Pseudobutyrivibrio sp. OR37 TaxID=1798186 RepID=UPI0008ED4E10|nr:oligosaccharide flippase family protein [Pseudobutyrivibrio sp. OR37]SFH96050.1 Membrane protein involved in the export of O-antigen and teichoic acid [Pseudobutyrivibrio sp. OR37]
MGNNIKHKILSGVFWKFLERAMAQLVSMLVAIVLARLLNPGDYGTIALVTIFITIANVFVTDGFGSSLIQKKDADNVDFSTVFYFNIVFCLFLYSIVFWVAPFVASFYEKPILTPVLRVLAIKILISSLNSVQHAYVARNMLFKRFFYSTLIGTIISAFVGIWMAYHRFGVWALVAQELTNCTIDMIVLWFTVKWRPSLNFSVYRLKELFDYGWKLLVQSLLNNIYGNLRNLIIGKVYSSEDLAYYTKGSYYPNLIIANIDTALNSALFPAMSHEQEDVARVKLIARRSLSMCSYVLSPVLVGFAVTAPTIVNLVLTAKWLPIVPFIKIFCASLMLRPALTAMLQAVKAVGNSNLVLKYDIPLRIIGICLIIVTVKFGTIYIALGEVVVEIVGLFLYSIACKKSIDYSLFEVLKDVIPNILGAIIMGIIVYFVGLYFYSIPNVICLLIQIFAGVVSYIGISLLTKNENFMQVLKIINKR